MQATDLYPDTSATIGWGFFRNTCSKYGVPPALLEGLFTELLDVAVNFTEISMAHDDRKWEVVSGYQKAVRRGEEEEALRMASAILNGGKEIPYLWRRVCTTAAEDIGYANPPLVAFTILCAATFTPSKFASVQKRVIYGLTHLLCESVKDRSMCDMSVIQNYGGPALEMGALTAEEETLFHRILGYKEVVVEDPILSYLGAQTWRTEGMGQFFPLVSTIAPAASEVAHMEVPPSRRLKGIKEYAYDMHTRVGKGALSILSARPQLKDFFSQYPVKDKTKALGWAVFYCEGGLLDKQILYDARDEVYNLAVKAPLCSMGVPPEQLVDFLVLVDSLLVELTEIRAYVLRPLYVK